MDFTEILSLLGQSDDEHAARLEELLSSAEDADLAGLEDALSEKFDEVRGEKITKDSVALLTEITELIERTREIAAERIAAAELVAELDGRVHVEAEAEEAEVVKVADAEAEAADDAEAETEEVADEAEETEAVADEAEVEETVEADDEVVAEAEIAVEAEAVIEEAEAILEDEAELVADGTIDDVKPTTATATKEEIMSRTPKQFAATDDSRARVTIKAAGGGTFESATQVEDALVERFTDLAGTGRMGVGKFRVATIEGTTPSDNRLPDNRVTDVTEMATEVRRAITIPGGAEALVADGGLCAPVENYYGLETISQATRPLRDTLATFTARRGGIQFVTPLTLADINATATPTSDYAIGAITEAEDAAGTYDKKYQTISCGDLVEKRIDAVYLNLRFGNFMARTFPERTTQFTDLSVAAYARFSEQRLFAAMQANSTQVFATQALGASRDLINELNRAGINYRARHRMPVDATLDVVIPAWVGRGLLPDDQVNSLNAYDEQFNRTAAWVTARLAERGLRVANWYQDEFTTAVADAGALPAYPTSFSVLMYHPGAHVYVDGGSLDLGVYRDATMISDNIFGTFVEEFWNTAMWGVESLDIEFSLCPSGASAGTLEPSCGS